MISLATKDDQEDVVRIFAHPDVLPHIAFDEPTWMLSQRVEETWDRFAYFLLQSRRGWFQIEQTLDDSAVMVHAASYPEARGREMIEGWREVAALLEGVGVERVYAWIPRSNARAWMFALLCGLRPCDEPESNPRSEHYTLDDGDWLTMSLKERQWAVR